MLTIPCKFYEYDDAAYSEHHEQMKHLDVNYCQQVKQEKPTIQCENFCKYYDTVRGYPGETLICCTHPDNEHILDANYDDVEV